MESQICPNCCPTGGALFDADAWLAQGRANVDKLPDGVVLPDWAEDAVVSWANSKIRLADYLRQHCRPIGDVK